jgi:hypothetical protein
MIIAVTVRSEPSLSESDDAETVPDRKTKVIKISERKESE